MLLTLSQAPSIGALLLFIPLALATAGCGEGSSSSGGGGSPVPGCTLGFLGERGKPTEIQLVARGAGLTPTMSPLADHDQVAMILPPQGGRVILVGARATNINACAVDLKGVLKDTATGQIRVDERTVNLQPDSDGWGGSVAGNISTFANVPTCPNQWASQDIYGSSFELTVSVADSEGNKASKTVNVVPFCAEPENADECACECKKDYKLGQMCEPTP
ncbi:MAG: hypothetical protein U0359_14880 [Byssovorax sp.]